MPLDWWHVFRYLWRNATEAYLDREVFFADSLDLLANEIFNLATDVIEHRLEIVTWRILVILTSFSRPTYPVTFT